MTHWVEGCPGRRSNPGGGARFPRRGARRRSRGGGSFRAYIEHTASTARKLHGKSFPGCRCAAAGGSEDRDDTGPVPALTPAAEGGVVDAVLTGELGGGQPAALKVRQPFGAPRCVRAP